MNTKFKFGDRVKYKMLGECVVINSSEHFCYVMNEKGDYNTIANPEEIELIPHPDTERLDWIESRSREVSETAVMYDGYNWYSNTSEEYPIELGFPYETIRQAIDNVMQQEQAK